jgi:hypothetical protein
MVTPLSIIPSGPAAGGNLTATPNCNAGPGRLASRNRRFRGKIHPSWDNETVWEDWLATWYE